MAAAIRIGGIDPDALMSGAHWRKRWPEGIDDGNDDADILNIGGNGRDKIKRTHEHKPFKWEWTYDEDVINTQESLELAGAGKKDIPTEGEKPAEGKKEEGKKEKADKPKEEKKEEKKEAKKEGDKKEPKKDEAAEEVIDEVKDKIEKAKKEKPWYHKRGMDIVEDFRDPTGNILNERRNPDGSLTKATVKDSGNA